MIKIILGGTMVSVAILPFVISEVTFFPGNFARAIFFRIIVEVLAVAYLGLILINRKYLPPFNLLTLAVAGWWLFLGVSTFFSPQPLFSFWGGVERMEGFFTLSHYFLFFFILAGTLKENRLWFLLFNAGVAASTLVSVIAILQTIGVAFTQPYLVGSVLPRATATLESPLFLSSYLLFFVFTALTLFVLNIKKTTAFFYGGAFLLNTIALFATDTRSGQIAFAIGIVWFILLLPLKHRLVTRGKILAGALAILILLLFTAGFITDSLARALEQLPFVPRLFVYATDLKGFVSSLDQRLDLWKIAWEGIRARPVFGYGPESFALVMDRFFPPHLNEFFGQQWLNEPVSVPLSVFLSGGLFAIIFYVAIFLILFWGLVIKQRKSLLFHGIFAVFLVYLVQGIVNIDHTLTYILFFIFLAFAATSLKNVRLAFLRISLPFSSLHPPSSLGTRELAGLGILSVIVLTGAFFLNVQPLLANRAIQKTIEIAGETKQLRDATSYFNSHREALVRSANVIAYDNSLAQLLVVLDQITTISMQEHPDETKEVLENAVALTKQEQRFKPKFSKPYFLLAKLYLKLSQLDPEVKMYAGTNFEKATEFSPNRYILWIEWAKSDPLLGNPTKAIEHGKKALALAPNAYALPEANFWIGVGYIYNGWVKDAQPYLAYLKTPAAYQYLERTYKRTNNYEFLINTFYPERIAEDPKNLQWHASLAVTYYETGNIGKACEVVRNLLREPDITPESRASAEEFLKQLSC